MRVYADARRARDEFGFLRMWSIHPAQIDPIVDAMRPEAPEVENAAAIIAAAQDADWGPLRIDGELHDRASYRQAWTMLQRAHAAGVALAAARGRVSSRPVRRSPDGDCSTFGLRAPNPRYHGGPTLESPPCDRLVIVLPPPRLSLGAAQDYPKLKAGQWELTTSIDQGRRRRAAHEVDDVHRRRDAEGNDRRWAPA